IAYEEIALRAEEANIITRISTEIAAQLDMNNLLQSVVDAISSNLRHYHAHIYLLDDEQTTLLLAAGAGEIGEKMTSGGHSLGLDTDSLVARAARTQETVVVSNVFMQPDYLPSPDLPRTRAEMAIPLLYGTELLGVLDIQDDRPRDYTIVEIQTRQTLANQVAIGIKNAVIFDDISRYAEDANTITELSAEIAERLDTDELLWRVANITKEKFNRYHAHIYLLNDTQDTLLLAAGAGDIGRTMVTEGHQIRVSADSLVARAARTLQPVVADNTFQQRDFLPNPYLPRTSAEMAIPLLYGGRVLGVLDIQDDKIDKFTQTEVQTQQTLANQIAIAINNARSFQQLQASQGLLAENEERLNAALEGSSDGLWDWNLITNDVYLSPRWKLILGYQDDELQNTLGTWSELLHPDDNDMAQAAVGAHLDDPENIPYDVEFRMQHKDGSYRWILARGAVRLNDAGQQERLVGTHSDITDRKEVDVERAILFEASQKLANATTIDDVFAAIYKYAASIGSDSGTLFYITLDEQTQPEWAIAQAVWDKNKEPAVPVGTRFYLPDFTFSQLWLDNPNTATLINDMQTDASVDKNTHEVYAGLGIHGAVLLPLYYQRRWVGIITLNWSESANFNDTNFRIFTELMRQSTAQVDAIRIAEEVAAARQRAEILAAINEQLSQAGDEADIIMVLANYTQYAQPDEIILSYIDSNVNNNPELIFPVTVWSDGLINTQYPLLGQQFKISDVPFSENWIQNPYVPTVITNTETDERVDENSRGIFRQTHTVSTIILPQYSNGRWQGVISFVWAEEQDFSEDDLYIYQNIATSLSAVIASRRDYLASQQAAMEASMLYNIT
ncbi:MAG: GAF domain-containing protein, partial [Aggregatilineales bacterium]